MGQRDADATRARILSAAIAEFAAHGHAGGRVERIAAAAGSNVRMIYAYFGNKSRLFDAAVADAIRSMAETVPPRPEDLAGWAGELFDFHGGRPEVLRICLWAQLERPDAASEPLETYAAKVDEVAPHAPAEFGAVELLVITYAVAQSWQLAPHGLVQVDATATDASRRASVVTAVGRMISGADAG